ncbi:syntaxin-17-like [Gigantopelta aegis]|uniref:syntaxin-17-like n=1 Tax=Gigantopelta aegis TaxID=1735272 RepID=UPI001B88A468|nr:syntaxin-17-like [Gigantopelta aegis]
MASFDRSENERPSDVVHKYPIRRLEPSIKKFIKVLEIDLDRLHRHGMNMQKFITIEDWVGLNKEQINASRTIQQIKANIREIEKARKQTCDDDLRLFDEKVEDMKVRALEAVQEFIQSEPESTPTSLLISKQDKCEVKQTRQSLPCNDDFSDHTVSLPVTTGQFQLHQELHVVPENSEAAASWENLQESLEELSLLVNDFAQMVDSQGEKLDNIEGNIETAAIRINEGTRSLGTAAKIKAVAFPVTGALIGGIAGGPIGFLAGAKLGLAAAGIGGIVGFAGGRLLKNRQQKVVELEMSKMTAKRSTSLPEIVEDKNPLSRFFSWFPGNETKPSTTRPVSESDTDAIK